MTDSTVTVNVWEILDGYGAEGGVFIRPSMVKIFRGNGNAAILCAQFLYWQRRTKNPEGWFYNTALELTTQTGLSEESQRTARAAMTRLGVLEEVLAGTPGRLHYRLDVCALAAFLTGQAVAPHDKRLDTLKPGGLPNQEQVPGNPRNKYLGLTGNKYLGIPGTIPSTSKTPTKTPTDIEAQAPNFENLESQNLQKPEDQKHSEHEPESTDVQLFVPGSETVSAGPSEISGRGGARRGKAGQQAGGALSLVAEQSQGILKATTDRDHLGLISSHAPCLDNKPGAAAWLEWTKARRGQRKPINAELAERQLGLLAPLTTEQAIATLGYSSSRGYQGLFPEKFSGKIGGAQSSHEKASAMAAQASEMLDNLRRRG